MPVIATLLFLWRSSRSSRRPRPAASAATGWRWCSASSACCWCCSGDRHAAARRRPRAGRPRRLEPRHRPVPGAARHRGHRLRGRLASASARADQASASDAAGGTSWRATAFRRCRPTSRGWCRPARRSASSRASARRACADAVVHLLGAHVVVGGLPAELGDVTLAAALAQASISWSAVPEPRASSDTKMSFMTAMREALSVDQVQKISEADRPSSASRSAGALGSGSAISVRDKTAGQSSLGSTS